MTDAEARELAKEHWEFLSPLVNAIEENNLGWIPLVKHLYIESMVHGVRHEREEK